jgi:hypothetical protein
VVCVAATLLASSTAACLDSFSLHSSRSVGIPVVPSISLLPSICVRGRCEGDKVGVALSWMESPAKKLQVITSGQTIRR